MNLTKQIAEHFRQLYFGGNWTSVNLKETLNDVDWMMVDMFIHPVTRMFFRHIIKDEKQTTVRQKIITIKKREV